MSRRPETGQMAVMIVGFFVVIGLLAVVVINASAAYLQHQQLANAADGAALTAAQTVAEDSIYRKGVEVGDLPLNSQSASAAVGAYLRGATGIRWQVVLQKRQVNVQLARRLRLPLVPPGWMDDTLVTARASAVLRVHQ